MPAKPGALIKYMRTQICTFRQSEGGFPKWNKGAGFPKTGTWNFVVWKGQKALCVSVCVWTEILF